MMKRWIYPAIFSGLLIAGASGKTISVAIGPQPTAEDVLLPNAVFEVATFKPSDASARGSSAGAGKDGVFSSKNQSLRNTICDSYNVRIMQCLGGSGWLESDRYDIEAKPDSDTTEQMLKLSWKQREPIQQRMQQALLADRLKLKVHFETREMPIFALVIAKRGLKMQEAKPDNTYASGLKIGTRPLGRGGMTIGNGNWSGQGISIDSIVANLTNITGHFVENKTELTGTYDFALQYSNVEPPPPDSTSPSIYTALEEQLGLKLESTKGPVQVLVIDHVERPSDN